MTDTLKLPDQRPVPRRHPLRWVAAIIVFALVFLLLRSFAYNPNFEWPVFLEYFLHPTVLKGVLSTLWLTVWAMLIGLVVGVIIAIMRISTNPLLMSASWGYINFFRAVPVLVQLIFWYNLAALYPVITLPFFEDVVRIDANLLITPMTAAMLGLGLNEAANLAEIIRGGLMSVDKGQGEAAKALGMSGRKTLSRVVLPQALKVIVPPIGNQVILMLKMTSLVSIISMHDLLYTTQIISARTFYTIPLLMVAAAWYLILTVILSIAQHFIEQYYSRSVQ